MFKMAGTSIAISNNMFRKFLCLILSQLLISLPALAGDSVFAPSSASGQFVASPNRKVSVKMATTRAPNKTAVVKADTTTVGAPTKAQMGVTVTDGPKPPVSVAKGNNLIYPNVGSSTQVQSLAAQIAAGKQSPLIFPNSGALPYPQSSPGNAGGSNSNPMSNFSQILNGGNKNANNSAYNNYMRNNSSMPQRNDPYVAGDLDPLSGGNQCNVPVQKADESLLASAPIETPNLSGYNCDKSANTHTKDRMTCMVCNLIYEVDTNDNMNGYLAVAKTVMTRAMSSNYPATVCGVVYQPAQFSWTDESKDHHLPNMNSARMKMAIEAAKKALETGPNGFDNYYSPKGMLAITHGRTNKASWADSGNCAQTHCAQGNGSHIFCANQPKQDRSAAAYLKAENLSPIRSLASADETTTSK